MKAGGNARFGWEMRSWSGKKGAFFGPEGADVGLGRMFGGLGRTFCGLVGALVGPVGHFVGLEKKLLAATLAVGQPSVFTTTVLLDTPGALVSVKVYAITADGRESASAAVLVQRP